MLRHERSLEEVPLTFATLTSRQAAAPPPSPVAGVWLALSEQVRRWRPDVVVLVARKMPRLAQALDLDFGARVITDLAIPFDGSDFDGARVAVVDDIVNVGSTMANARDAVIARQAADVQLFAIGFRSERPGVLPRDAVVVVNPDPLGDHRTSALSAEVPRLLRALERPYDLDFPVLECAPLPPFSDIVDVSRGMATHFGTSAVREVTSWEGRRAGVCRVSVDIGGVAPGWLTKLRIYGRIGSPHLRVVPMAVPPIVTRDMLPTKDPLWEQLTEPLEDEAINSEPGARAAMFCYSLAFGLHAIDLAGSVLQLTDPSAAFNRDEASIAFGPIVHALEVPCDYGSSTPLSGLPPIPVRRSPFAEHALADGLVPEVARRAGCSDPAELFEAVFGILSEWVGSDDPAGYRLTGPRTRDEVIADPYLRLRIGPTWPDLAHVVRAAAYEIDGDRGVAHCSDLDLSATLDRFVDGGSVVPTFSQFGDELYRIYRKGETDPHEEIVERVSYAWAAYGQPLSRTRATKVLTVLGLAPNSEVPFSISALERGNVACMPRSILDEDAELTRYLRDTGHLRQVSSNDENDADS
jgi:hypothetical protein